MGGREGGRGYLYQSIATLLGSLKDEEWKYVEVEVESDNDKIDIQWEYDDGKIKVVQVKSSQNNIPKSSMIRWLKDLTSDAPEANQFQLFLIGNVQDTTSKFISKVNRIKDLEKDDDDYDNLKDLIKFLPKIEIVLENFNQTSLEAQVKWGINELLSTMGHVVNHTLIGLMADGMLSQFARFSTNGRKVIRDKYIKQFEEWIYYNYPEVQGHGLTKKVLSVEFYLKDQVNFSTSIKGLTHNSNKITNDYKSALLGLIDSIKEIHLHPYASKNPEVSPFDKTGIFNFSGVGITTKSKEYSDEFKEELIAKTKSLLGVDIEKNFFYVGQLKSESNPLNLATRISPNTTTLKGNEVEKEKGELIDKFCFQLYQYEGIVEYFTYLDSFKIVPLVLRNTGSTSDEEIEVNIKFPKNVNVATLGNLNFPNEFAISQFNEDDGLLNLFKHTRSYNIEEYFTSTLPPSHLDILRLAARTQAERDKRNKEKFSNQLEYLFKFEVFEDTKYTVLQFHFNKLNASKNMAFPSFLLVDAEESFSMDYEITSRNLGKQITGSLYYEILDVFS